MLETYVFYLQYHTTSRFKVSLFLKSMCVVCFYKPNILSNSLPNGNAFEILSFPQQPSKKREGKLSGGMGNMPGWSIFLLKCLPTHISGPERHGTRDVCQRLWPWVPWYTSVVLGTQKTPERGLLKRQSSRPAA